MILILSLLFSLNVFAQETGPADSVIRVPAAGGRARAGSIDLSKSAAVGSSLLPMANGGCNKLLVASAGSLLYSDANSCETTAVGSSGQIMQSAGTSAPAWSTATYPATTTANQILYSSATNTVGGISTAATSALVTNSSSVPSLVSGSTANRLLRTNGTAISFAQAALTTDVTGTLPVANGGTGTATAFTSGSVVFAGGSGVYTEDNSDLFWDDSNKYFSIGTATPLTTFNIYKATSPTFLMQNSTSGEASASRGLSLDLTGANASLWNYENGYLRFGANNTEKVRIDPTTDVSLLLSETSDKAMRLNQVTTASLPSSPLEAMLAYDDTLNGLTFYDGAAWIPMGITAQWTPTYTDVTAISAKTHVRSFYSRVGFKVDFVLRVTIDPSATTWQLDASLPVASAATSASTLIGNCDSNSASTDTGGVALGMDATNDRMTISGATSNIGNVTYYCVGSYILDI